MTLSHINPSIYEMHDFKDREVTFDNILRVIHPGDLNFVVKAEAFLTHFFSKNINH